MKQKKASIFSLIWYKVSNLLLWIPGLFLVLLLLGFAILQIPKIQTDFINSASKYISKNTSFSISIKKANLTWYDKMLIGEVKIYDHKTNDTLISIREAKIDIVLWDLIVKKEVNAELLELNSPTLYINKTSDSTDVNITKFLKEIKAAFKKDNPSKKKSKIFIRRIEMTNGRFCFDDDRKTPMPFGKDYYHFEYKDITSTFSQFSYTKDSLGLQIDRFKGIDPKDQLNINSLYGTYYYTPKAMSMYGFNLETDRSKIRDSIVFKYNTPNNFVHFNDSIEFICHFDKSTIDGQELSLFNKNLRHYNNSFKISGDLSGRVSQLEGENLNLEFGNSSIFKGKVAFYGLPSITETFMDIKVKNSTIDIHDLSALTNNQALQKFKDIEKMDFEGNYTGFFSDFVANGIFTSTSGRIITDINLKIDDNETPHYSGYLGLDAFDLSQVFGKESSLGETSMNGVINGHGLQMQNAFFKLNATIDSLIFDNYKYTSTTTAGIFEKEYFQGNLNINDPNLSFDGQLEIDLRDRTDKFEIKANLKNVNLDKLGYSKVPLSLSTIMDIDMKGLNTEEMIGYLNLSKNSIVYNNDSLAIDSIKILSSRIEKLRLIHLETDGIVGELIGNYNLTDLQKSLVNFYNELKINIDNDTKLIEAYYAQKPKDSLTFINAQLDIRLWDLNNFVKPFIPNFKISKNIKIHADLKQDSLITIDFNTSIDSLELLEYQLYDNEFAVNISKNLNSKDVYASAFSTSEHQIWFNDYELERIFTDINWNKNEIRIISNFEQKSLGNEIELNTNFSLLNDSIRIHFNPSRIFVLDKAWAWNKSNAITYHNEAWDFSDFKLFNDSEYLSVEGKYSTNLTDQLEIGISNFELENLKSISTINYQGILDGKINIKQTVNTPLIEGNIVAKNVFIEGFHIGNVFGLSTWNSQKKRLSANLDIIKDKNKKIALEGFIYPNQPLDQLNLKANLTDVDLTFIQPFVKNNFENLKGYVSGSVLINGNTKAPIIKGKTHIKDGFGTIKYLKTSYEFDGNVLFDNNEIQLKDVFLFDSEKNKAVFSGTVRHENFQNYGLNLRADFRNFLLLNTTSTDNYSYYGTAYGSGYVNFLGTLDNITITSETRSTKGTRIAIPIGGLTDYSSKQEEYIEFVDLTSEDQINALNTLIGLKTNENKVKGIKLDFDIEMTTDAYLELIFDVKAGDIIRGRGNGNIKLQINTDGDFNMFGDYIIDKGGYNFTLYNIINKEFSINKGSSISWYGDPYEAKLAIDAKYSQQASLSPILTPYVDEDDINSTELRRKYTSIVNLNLTQDLLSPKIKFDIAVEDYPNSITLTNSTLDIESILTAFKARLESNEQEMNRQVLSLIILRKFLIENEFDGAQTAGSIGSSLSEFISNQLSYWATQVDENLEIDVDLASLDNDAFNTFQLRLSYTFFDGRLRVTRGGALPNEETKNSVTAIIGDWSVEYLLTPDGRLRIKMYSRTDQNNINLETGNNGLETGVSLQAVRNFNEFKELIGKSRKQEQEKKAEKHKGLKKEEEDVLL